MSQAVGNQAQLLIEDRLDAIGQKIRVLRLLRGMMLWIGWGIASMVAVCLTCHFLRQGRWATAVALAWGAWLVASAIVWIVRPLMMRPAPLQTARLIESRVQGLHNGLTNSVLLARAGDLSGNPFLPQIFAEVLATTLRKPLDAAVRWSQLGRLAARLSLVAAPALVVAIVWHAAMAQGWQQMLAPMRFVPQVGEMVITDVQPGAVTLVAGQPLEITVLAWGPQSPEAKLIFEGPSAAATLIGTPTDDGQLRYGYRLDHVDASMRYRAEVGSTQSDWFAVTVVRQVKLTGIELNLVPPPYTKLPRATISLKPEELAKGPISMAQGSVVDIDASVDVPARRAMLQVGDDRQLEMEASQENHSFHQRLTVLADTTLWVGLMEGQQIIAKLPENGLAIHCRLDEPPKVQMTWPNEDGLTVPPRQELTIRAALSDDYGVTAGRVLVWIGQGPLTVAGQVPAGTFTGAPQSVAIGVPIHLTAEQARHGQSIHVQVEVDDNRDLTAAMQAAGLSGKDAGGVQTARGPSLEIKFADPEQIERDQKDRADKLRERLLELLKMQQDLQAQAVAFKAGDKDAMDRINSGQTDLRNKLTDTAEKFEFDAATAVVKRTLQELAVNPAHQAIELSAAIGAEPVAKEQLKVNILLRAEQQHIISTLESLLAMLNLAKEPTTQPADKSHDPLLSNAEAYKKLDEAIQQYMKEQRRILDQTASLAKKPVDDFDDNDKKKLDDLRMSQEKLDAFMQQTVSDFSKNAEQDMSNSELLKELFEIQAEVTMAKDALNAKSVEIAVPAEENGLELAKELESNIEKWLSTTPHHEQWTQEDPLSHTDAPMPELPKELEDQIGQLMEDQEDLFQDMEDANANWQDSADKGVGWGAQDGPIADMSAKGVTGNQLPSNNEMQGRSGEGRNGQSQGEFVGDSAVGKGGRDTPTRLDPTAFAQGQINDQSKDPVGGATGGGKLSGQGGAGLEGPVPPKVKQEMQRLAQKQAELRNNAERLNLQYQLSRYDNFKMLQSIALMRCVESDLQANRYQNALRRRDMLVDSLDTAQMLLGGRVHVQEDTTPQPRGKTQQEINDAMKGELPPAWSEALKEYYRKLSEQQAVTGLDRKRAGQSLAGRFWEYGTNAEDLMDVNWHDMFVVTLPLVLEKILRPVVVYLFLVVGLRLAGKRELAQLNPFDLIVLLTLSNTVQNAIIGNDNTLTGGIIGASALLAINYLFVRFLHRHAKLQALAEGKRDYLIRGGEIQSDHLNREMMSRAELAAAAHRQGITSLTDVEEAILEPAGTISFKAKSPTTAETRHDQLVKAIQSLQHEVKELRAARQ